MKFDPKCTANTIREGEVVWQVIKAADHISKPSEKNPNGKESIKIMMKIWDNLGNEGFSTCYIGEPWKLKQFCRSCGMLDKFESGEIIALDCEGKSGNGITKIEIDVKGVYEDKNVIVKFLEKEEKSTPKAEAKKPEFDDDLPF